VDPSYEPAPHIKLLCEKLEAVERGEITRLMVSAPPRHSKTETVSKKFSSWYLGRHPNDPVILSSYGADLARKSSREVRNIMESERYGYLFPGVTTARYSRAVNDWDLCTPHKGGMRSAGVGGGITGMGAKIFIIDDPFRGRKEAESKTYRESVWEWYTNVARTRLEPGAAIIIIMTRWHQDDLCGRLLKEQAEKWDVVNFKATAEPPRENRETRKLTEDPLGRKPGQALWPWRFDEEALADTKHDVGSRTWEALYQGEPKDPASLIFQRDWFKMYDDVPPECARAGGIDTATSKKTLADYMAMVDVCVDENGYLYCDDAFLERLTVSGFANHVCNEHEIKKYSGIGIEENNAGEAVKQRIDERGRELKVYPPVTGFTTSTDKVIRAMEFQPQVENGTIKFKRGNPKVAALIDHLVDFDGTGGSIDDDVDALGFAIKAAASGVIKPEDIDVEGDDRDFSGGGDRMDQSEMDF